MKNRLTMMARAGKAIDMQCQLYLEKLSLIISIIIAHFLVKNLNSFAQKYIDFLILHFIKHQFIIKV